MKNMKDIRQQLAILLLAQLDEHGKLTEKAANELYALEETMSEMIQDFIIEHEYEPE